MSIQGSLFTLAMTDRDGGEPHPHVVVVELGGTTCLVVPCYTPGKPAVTSVIESSRKLAHFDHQIFLTVNHATCVKPIDPKYTFTEACYILERADVLDISVVSKGKLRGVMNSEQVTRIARGVLDMNEAHGGNRLTARCIKLLSKMVGN